MVAAVSSHTMPMVIWLALSRLQYRVGEGAETVPVRKWANQTCCFFTKTEMASHISQLFHPYGAVLGVFALLDLCNLFTLCYTGVEYGLFSAFSHGR